MKKLFALLALPLALLAAPTTPINNAQLTGAAHVLAGASLTADPGSTVTGFGATLNGITAATADQAGIANGNFNVRWNWQKTADAQTAFEFGESAASTGGTSTGGVPNQVIGKFSTLPASTASPLSVYSQGNHVFSVSPTSAQILGAAGTATAPSYSFAGNPAVGMRIGASGSLALTTQNTSGTYIYFQKGGTPVSRVVLDTGQWQGGTGSATAPAFTDFTFGNAGIFTGSSLVGFSVNGAESARLALNGSDNILQLSNAQTDGNAFAQNFRKSRGTVAAPTVITTGDDLASMNGFGYVGATNTYLQAAQMKMTSTGTIADTTTGIGGIITLATTLQGTDTSPQTNLKISNGSAGLVQFQGTGGAGYITGAGTGGAVTQLTSRTTGVTINKPTGQITMFSAAGSATPATFTVSNTSVAATDTITLNQQSGTNLYEFFVTAVAANSFNVTFFTTGGTATDAPVINFAVLKGSAN